MEDDALDSDELTPEQAAVIERELHRVFGNRLADGMDAMLLPLISYEEFIAVLANLPTNASNAQLRAGLEQVRAARPPLLSESE